MSRGVFKGGGQRVHVPTPPMISEYAPDYKQFYETKFEHS